MCKGQIKQCPSSIPGLMIHNYKARFNCKKNSFKSCLKDRARII